jgi:hypothetical protein
LRRLAGSELHAAQVRLLRRYLDAFAPASIADYATWSGLNVRDARAAWDTVAPELVSVEVEGRPAWLPAARLPELDELPAPSPFVRLLPAFDTYILGHKSRELLDPAGAYEAVYKGGGMLPPMILVDGRILGIWQPNRKGRKVKVVLDPFAPLPAPVAESVAAEVADIERFVAAT